MIGGSKFFAVMLLRSRDVTNSLVVHIFRCTDLGGVAVRIHIEYSLVSIMSHIIYYMIICYDKYLYENVPLGA